MTFEPLVYNRRMHLAPVFMELVFCDVCFLSYHHGTPQRTCSCVLHDYGLCRGFVFDELPSSDVETTCIMYILTSLGEVST